MNIKKDIDKKIEKEMDKLSSLTRMVKGDIYKIHNTCGNKNCKCQRGEKHTAYQLTYKGKNNITKTVYIKKDLVEETRKLIKNRKKAEKIFAKILDLNIDLLKASKL